MKAAILRNEHKIKWDTFSHDYTTYKGEEVHDEYYITGIGNKAIKYEKNGDGEDRYAWYDKPEGYKLCIIILTSFENEVWNNEIKNKIKLQKDFCKENEYPNFAPEDGFCWSCGHQIYNDISEKEASSELITGCPVCRKSYCD